MTPDSEESSPGLCEDRLGFEHQNHETTLELGPKLEVKAGDIFDYRPLRPGESGVNYPP